MALPSGERLALRPAASPQPTLLFLTLAGNTVAKIVSPIVSVVVVTLVGAAVSYFQRNRRRNCFRTHGKLCSKYFASLWLYTPIK